MAGAAAGWEVSTPDLEARAGGLAQLLEEFSFLAQSHVTDFYTKDLWGTLPPDWRATLETLSPDGALEFISLLQDPAAQLSFLEEQQRGARRQVAPSLARFLRQLAALPLPRHPAPGDAAPCAGTAGGAWCGFKVGEGLTRGMTPKKLHEVERLASFVSRTVDGSLHGRLAQHDKAPPAPAAGGVAPPRDHEYSPREVMVDVGSGQGYLSRVLALRWKFPVVAVELDEENIRRARETDARVALEVRVRLVLD